MSINATLKPSQGVINGKPTLTRACAQGNTKKLLPGVKSQKVENSKCKSKFAHRPSRILQNENDKNCVNINLNKEIFEDIVENDHKRKSLNDNDVNVLMKSSKDDSAIKENENEKASKEIILETLGLAQESTTCSFLDKKTLNAAIKTTSTNGFLSYENLLINLDSTKSFPNDEYRRACTHLLRKDYSSSILSSLLEDEALCEDYLQSHKVTERMRCRMVDWMIEVLSNYHCQDQTFFIAIGLMDRFFKALENKKCLQPGELHLIGVSSMFIASKYQDIYPLRLKVIQEKIAHRKLSCEEIKIKEEEMTKVLNYAIAKPSIWDFISIFIEEIFYVSFNNHLVTNKILLEKYMEGGEKQDNNDKELGYELNKIYTSNMLNLLNHVTVYLAKMNCHDYQLMNKKPSLLAASTIFVAIKICEQINKEEYINDYFTKKLTEVSRKAENEIIKCAQKILYNAQNFDTIFTGLENLKKVHFNAIIELKNTK